MEFETNKYMQYLKEGDFAQALIYRADCVPDILYKFIPLFKSESENKKRFFSLENKMIWASPISLLNDPFEFKGMYLHKKSLVEAGVPEESISYIEKSNEESFDIISLCDNSLNNLPMWAHYTNNHAGFCLEFKVRNKFRIRNVIYVPERIPLCNTFLKFLDASLELRKNPSVEVQNEINRYWFILQEMYFIKHESWKQEKEFRLLCDHQEKNGHNVLFEELGLELCCIYTGINCRPDDRKELESIASVIHVPLKYCETSETEFAVFI